jgi:hypothetical protein
MGDEPATSAIARPARQELGVVVVTRNLGRRAAAILTGGGSAVTAGSTLWAAYASLHDPTMLPMVVLGTAVSVALAFLTLRWSADRNPFGRIVEDAEREAFNRLPPIAISDGRQNSAPHDNDGVVLVESGI